MQKWLDQQERVNDLIDEREKYKYPGFDLWYCKIQLSEAIMKRNKMELELRILESNNFNWLGKE